jgi:hypothetical protein
MRQNASWAAVALLLAWQTAAYGQGASSKAAGAPVPAAPTPVVQQLTAPKDLTEIAAQLRAIQSGIVKLTEKADKTDYTPAKLGFLGVVIGGAITFFTTFFTQRRLITNQRDLAEKAAKDTKELADAKAAQERELAGNRAKLEIGNSFVQWQLKQLSELYGPLHALLRQSNALYRHMNTVLEKADPNRFRLRQGSPGDDFDNMVFEINSSGEWIPFRTIMHIGEVYGRNYGIEDYFDQVVAIGRRMVKVIAEKAGYVRPEQSDLVSVFGKYLAHYSVLERLHSSMKVKQAHGATAPAIVVDESAVFPREIQGVVDAGFAAIVTELKEWRAKAAA